MVERKYKRLVRQLNYMNTVSLAILFIVLLVSTAYAAPWAHNELPKLMEYVSGGSELNNIHPADTLGGVETWFYYLDFNYLDTIVDNITDSTYDMVVLEPIFTEKENLDYNISAVVSSIKNSSGANVANKLVIAYIDVGQAEDWRYYWWSNWTIGYPDFIVTSDADGWEGCYPVAFWKPGWQDIWFTGVVGNDSRWYDPQLKMLVDAGFDGVYLDWVEAYSDVNVTAFAETEGVNTTEKIIEFVGNITNYGRSLDPEFIVIAQNAAELARYDDYVSTIGAVAQEQVWFDGRGDEQPPEGDCPLPATDADVDSWWYYGNLSPECKQMYTDFPDSTLHISSQSYINDLTVAKNKNLTIFTVDYALNETNIQLAYNRSRALGFVPFASNRPLNQFIDPRPPAGTTTSTTTSTSVTSTTSTTSSTTTVTTVTTTSTTILASSFPYPFNSSELMLIVDNEGNITLYHSRDGQLLSLNKGSSQPFNYLVVGGETISFNLTSHEVRSIQNELGSGRQLVLNGSNADYNISVTLYLEIYDNYSNAVLVYANYTNLGSQSITVSRSSMCSLGLNASSVNESLFWSFQGGAENWGDDYIKQLEASYQENFQGPKGGIPAVDLWTNRTGLFIGSLAIQKEEIYLPVNASSESHARVSLEERNFTLSPGNTTRVVSSVIIVHSSDFYNPVRTYAEIMKVGGMPLINQSDFNDELYWSNWETYGYEEEWNISDITTKIGFLKELGVKVITIDSGWYEDFLTGDYNPDPAIFPNGDNSVRNLTDTLHANGFEVRLWWEPGIVEQDSELATNTNLLCKHANGTPIRTIVPTGSETDYYLNPVLPEVIEYHRNMTNKIFVDWGFDGVKQDMVFSMPTCYINGTATDSVKEHANIFREIYTIARNHSSKAQVELCNCGVPQNFYVLPYNNLLITSDPIGSLQVRRHTKLLKAIAGPRAPVLGDHVELTRIINQAEDLRSGDPDFASVVGTGGILQTRFTTNNTNANQSIIENWLLTEGNEQLYRTWFRIYNKTMLCKEEYLNLYDIGFSHPEGHAIRKGNNTYYGFYIEPWGTSFNGTIELRGLDDKTYNITDYVNNNSYGTCWGLACNFTVNFTNNLLLKAEEVLGTTTTTTTSTTLPTTTSTSTTSTSTTLLQLTSNSANDQNPSWSPDGTKILFTSKRLYGNFDLWVMDSNGSSQMALTNDSDADSVNMPGSSWCTLDDRIVFSSDRVDNDEIWVMNSSGGNLERVTNNPALDWEPTWSPDCEWIVYQSNRSGNWDIWKIRVDGSNATQLTTDANADWQPNWMFNGDLIVFQSNRTGDWCLWTMHSNGSNQLNVTACVSEDSDPSWSPDSSMIVYSSDLNVVAGADIYVINSTGVGTPIRLTNDVHYNGAPAWSPDGTKIAFESNRGGNLDLYLLGDLDILSTTTTTSTTSTTSTSITPTSTTSTSITTSTTVLATSTTSTIPTTSTTTSTSTSSTTTTLPGGPTTAEINLQSGWNLISLPLTQ